jgi:prolyl-tRNA editing enzyme YbaK/EbsC (Cys-tRNA(Pro) deacylase)
MSSSSPNLHPVTRRITDLLASSGCAYETFEHEPVRTSEEAARTRTGYGLHQGAKAIVVRTKAGGDTRFLMLVFPADRKFDSKKAKAALSVKDIRFATPDEVADVTGGVQVGAVPPFGNLFGLDVVADPALFDNERIVFNAGDRRFSVAMPSEDYRRLVQPRVIEIV